MDLVHQVAANLEIEPEKAEKGIGAILMALRMNLDGETFKKVKHVLPNSESLMGRALMGGARTGEMAALVGPAGLLAALAAAGYQKDDIPRLGRRVLERQGTQPSLLVPIELGTVALRPTFEAADPVFEHGDLQWRDFALARPAPEQRQPPAHRQRRRTPVRVTGTRAGAPWNSAGGSAIPWVRPVVAAP